MHSRRTFLTAGSSLLALTAATSGRALAGQDAQNLIIVFAYGGWDPTYLFDPRPSNPDVSTPDGGWREHGELLLWETASSSNVHAFLDDWSDRVAVINGVAVNSLVHEECARRLLTGSSTDATADIGARVADLTGRDRPLPYHVMGGNARLDGLEAIAGTSGYSNQISSLVVPRFAYPSDATAFQPSADEAARVAAYLSERAAVLAERSGTRGSSGVRLDDYLESHQRAQQILSSARDNLLSDPQAFYSYDAFDRAARMLAERFSKVAFLTDSGYWDTHTGNGQQARLFNSLFGSLRSLMSSLDEAGIADNTTVAVLSEMGRTPMLNRLGGKDHWPFTSAMLIGPTVRSTLVEGTDDDLQQTPVNLSTGLPDANGRALGTADLLATIAALVDIDPGQLYPDAEVIDAVVA